MTSVDIIFSSTKQKKEFNDHSRLVRRQGDRRTRLIARRLAQLRAAINLNEIGSLLPARCHELTGNLKGKLSVDLDHPYRLIIEPANDPVPLKEDGGLDWQRVTAIRIVRIEDTHG